MRTVYVNGKYLPEGEAKISIFDRGFLFGDAIYEVTMVLDGRLIDFDGHMERLIRSAREVGFAHQPDCEALRQAHEGLVRLNSLRDGHVYLQISRGDTGDRDLLFPPESVTETVVMFTQQKPPGLDTLAVEGKSVVTVDDLRWKRSDIKTVQLMYAAMVKTRATQSGADDTWMVLDGYVTEGANTNAFIVTKDGKLVTRQLSGAILPGITRKAILECALELALTLEERPFSVEEAKDAAEAFSTSSVSIVAAVTKIDGVAVGDGKPGKTAARLRSLYFESRKTADRNKEREYFCSSVKAEILRGSFLRS